MGTRNFVPSYSFGRTLFGEVSSDNWLAAVSGDDLLPDVHLGRLAAQSPEDAAQMVARVIAYDRQATSAPSLLLVAADDEPDFAQLSDSLASLAPARKVYAAAYPPGNPTQDILQTINHRGQDRHLCRQPSLGRADTDLRAFRRPRHDKSSYHRARSICPSSATNKCNIQRGVPANAMYHLIIPCSCSGASFEPVRCHTFITEATFGLPIYRWPAPASVFAEIDDWWRGGRTSAGKSWGTCRWCCSLTTCWSGAGRTGGRGL